MAEIFDIVDENLKVIGTKAREEVHRDGDWHRVFHCWVIFRDEEKRDWIILQKRSPNKDIYPNVLDVSVGGHYETGESLEKAGLREIQEELGLTVNFDDLIPLGIRIQLAAYNAIRDYEFADVFFHVCDQPLKSYDYQQEEIAGLAQLSLDEGIRLLMGEIDHLEVPSIGFETNSICITRNDFIPTIDDYYLKVFLLAKRCLDGEKHLFI